MESKKASVLVCTFTSTERQGWINPLLAKFFMDCAAADARGERRIGIEQITDKFPADVARNCAVKKFRETDYEWLLLIDNDQSLNVLNLEMLDTAPASAGIVCPRFYSAKLKDNNPLKPFFHLVWVNPATQTHPGTTEWVELETCGTGCMAIRRSVFDKVNAPYFEHHYNADRTAITLTEDWSFCRKVRAAGLKIFGNVKHMSPHWRTNDMTALAMVTNNANEVIIEKAPAKPSPASYITPAAFAAR